MRYTLLIALREFTENAKTKGFWIGIFMLPLLLAVSFAVSIKLAHSEPSRYFVVVDKSGAFAETIDQSIEWERQRSVLQALGHYVQQNLRAGQHPTIDLSSNPTDVNTFMAAGGKEGRGDDQPAQASEGQLSR